MTSMTNRVIKKGDTIKIDYEGQFEDGTIFDSSKSHGNPLEFEVGVMHVISGLDNAVIGMEEGEEKKITIKPEEGYGLIVEEAKQEIPRDKFPKTDKELKPGMMLVMGTKDGGQMPVKISKVDEETITLDMNHPLAGKTLIFQIKILSIEEKTEKKNVESIEDKL